MSSTSGALARTYSYDNAGNTTGDGTATFTYNDAGRMISATTASGTVTYALNALGQRVKKTTGGSPRYFVYDESGHLLGEYNNSGNLIQETIWFGDTPVATLRPNGGSVDVFYVHTDHLNTPRRISRPSDDVIVWRWDSDPFGATAANEDPDGDASTFVYGLGFPGQYFDADTGLHYNYMRDGYDTATGRYTQSDPIGLFGGLNAYAYVLGNPIRYVDVYGLVPGAGPLKPPPPIKDPAAMGVFGCVGLSCASWCSGETETQISMELSLGGGIEICDSRPPPPPPPPKKGSDCGMYDKRCDNQLQPPGLPLPKRFGGFLISPAFKRDGRFCVRIGPHVSVPLLPSLELGGLSE